MLSVVEVAKNPQKIFDHHRNSFSSSTSPTKFLIKWAVPTLQELQEL